MKKKKTSSRLTHFYKIDLELRQHDNTWKVYHSVEFEAEEFNDNFMRFVDKQLEGLYGIDRMVIYYDTEKNLKEMEKIYNREL